MKKLTPITLVVLALTAAALACDLPSFAVEMDPTAFARSVEGTIAAEVAQGGEQAVQEAPPVEAPPAEAPQWPTNTHEPTLVSTNTPTPTPSVPMVSVSMNTNCRTGPGMVYDLTSALLVGEEAEIVARSSVPNYVIIDDPDSTGTCWLWMQYGTQEGSTDALPLWTPPPTPTPAATPTPEISFTLSFSTISTCMGCDFAVYKVTNTGGVPLESWSISAENVDLGENISKSMNFFLVNPSCVISDTNNSLPQGASDYVIVGFNQPVSGATINATVTLCTGDGLGGECTSHSLTVSIP